MRFTATATSSTRAGITTTFSGDRVTVASDMVRTHEKVFGKKIRTNYRPRSRGDNTFGSVRVCVRLFVCGRSPLWTVWPLTFNLDFWHEGRRWPWLAWDYAKSRNAANALNRQSHCKQKCLQFMSECFDWNVWGLKVSRKTVPCLRSLYSVKCVRCFLMTELKQVFFVMCYNREFAERIQILHWPCLSDLQMPYP